jgi:hypothetical protein
MPQADVFVLKAKEFGKPNAWKLWRQKHDVAPEARRLPAYLPWIPACPPPFLGSRNDGSN